MQLKLKQLYTYPIKSCKGISLESTKVEKIGFEYDRNFAIINANNQILTARENQKLLTITPEFSDGSLSLTTSKQAPIEVDLHQPMTNTIEVGIFKDTASANIVGTETDAWISEALQEKCRLVTIDAKQLRVMKAKYNGQVGDLISFSDIAPIHLISKASITDLNTKLQEKVTLHNFRPNILVSGCNAYAEDNWTHITIGDCEFEVTLKAPRCIFTTINPISTKVNDSQEPLRTMSTYRKTKSTVDFGIYLKPTKLGSIRITDDIKGN